ncbi:MAG: transposase [Verrucomicrobiales bacterium]|nr:transposase [Verrucomicrobiales bacterium]
MNRLRRLDRLFQRDPVFFVTACTADRRSLLDRPSVKRCVDQFGERGTERGAFLGRFVLMPDHLHLFVAFGDQGPNLSMWMKSLKNSISKVLREEGVPAPHWQKGFMDHVLRSEESYAEKWEYVRRNPERAGLVEGPEDWPWQGEPVKLRV